MDQTLINVVVIFLIVLTWIKFIEADRKRQTSLNGRCPHCHSIRHINTRVCISTKHPIYPRSYICKCKLCGRTFNLPTNFYKE